MTAVYAPLQNASPSQRGAVTSVAQEIAGLKTFLDGLESTKQLQLANEYAGEAFIIEALPYTANGVPFSLGGPTVAAAPFWGVRAHSVVTGGPAGTIQEFGIGRFPGNGPIDLVGPDYPGQGVLPGLTFAVNAFVTEAALLAGEVLLGLNATGTAPALRIDEGKANFQVPVWLEHADAKLVSAANAFRFTDGFGDVRLRFPGNNDTPSGYELWGEPTYPLSMSRSGQQIYTQRGSMYDVTLGASITAVHAFSTELALLSDYLAVFGTHDVLGIDGAAFSSRFRISSKGAPEIVEKENLGPVSNWVVGPDAVVNATAASGLLQAPAAGTYAKVFINTPQCKAGSLPRVLTVGAVNSGGGVLLIPYVSAVANGQFTVEFKASDGSGGAPWAGGAGELRWEISR